ncbi:MAG: DNA gyrase subunit A [Bacillota bacterium]
MVDSKLINQNITKTLENNYMPYAMSVIVSRAIPEIDGFKPSHRKILYTMYEMKLLNKRMTKSANIVGQTMKLNPHGDSAIYQTMVRLSTGHDALLHPYVKSKGNFGKSTSKNMQYAASRYTEAKLADISKELFRDIEKNTVDFVDNYDGTKKEPALLPTTFPNILVNNNMGIAVGMASNISSFNLREVCNTTIAYIEDKAINLLDTLKAPDFSTGAKLIYDQKALKDIYETGKGGINLRANYNYMEEDNCIEIYEIPYTTTIEAIIKKIIRLVKNNKINSIKDIRDETDLNGLKITIDLKRGKDPEVLMGKLFKKTPLESSFSCNFNMLINGSPMTLGIKKILDYWLEFRRDSIKRKLQFEINKLSEKLHLLVGLEKVILDLDKAIEIIRKTKKKKDVVPNLIKNFEIDEIQAEYVANIKLRNINEEYIINRTSEIKELKKNKKQKEVTIKSKKKINQIIIDDLKRIKEKYGIDRKTEIVKEEEIIDHKPVNIIKDYNLKVFLTKDNYLKKIPLTSLRASKDHKLKENDKIKQSIEASNKSEVLLFSNKQMVYKRYLYEIDDHKASNLGLYLPNLLDMDDNEEIIYMVITKEYKGYMLFAYENGKVQKLSLDSYYTKTNRRYLKNAYSDKSPVVNVLYIKKSLDLALVRLASPNDYRLLIINSDLISEKATRKASGVRALRLKKNSELFKMCLEKDLKVKDKKQYFNDKIPRSGKKIDSMEILKALKYD